MRAIIYAVYNKETKERTVVGMNYDKACAMCKDNNNLVIIHKFKSF